MKKIQHAASLLVLLLVITGSGALAQTNTYSKKQVTKAIKLPHFSSINISGLAQVYLQQGQEPGALLHISGMPVEAVTVAVHNQVLSISTPKNYSGESVRIYVTYSTLTDLQATDATEVTTQGPITTEALHIILKNQSSATLQVKVHSVTIAMTDNADLIIKGNTKEQHIVSRSPNGSLNNSGLTID